MKSKSKNEEKITVENISKDLVSLYNSSKIYSSQKEVINDLVQVMFNLLFNQDFMPKARPNGINRCLMDSYHVSLDKYKKDLKAWEKLGDIAHDYMKLVATLPFATDVLAAIIEPFANTNLAQYLTPSDIADVLGMISMPNFQEYVEKSQVIKIGDITGSGTGALILGTMRNIYSQYGKRGVLLLDITAVDLDPVMCMATVVQIEMASIVHRVEYNKLGVGLGNALLEPKPFYSSIPNFRNARMLDQFEIMTSILKSSKENEKENIVNDKFYIKKDVA